jgi:hypothetical protein
LQPFGQPKSHGHRQSFAFTSHFGFARQAQYSRPSQPPPFPTLAELAPPDDGGFAKLACALGWLLAELVEPGAAASLETMGAATDGADGTGSLVALTSAVFVAAEASALGRGARSQPAAKSHDTATKDRTLGRAPRGRCWLSTAQSSVCSLLLTNPLLQRSQHVVDLGVVRARSFRWHWCRWLGRDRRARRSRSGVRRWRCLAHWRTRLLATRVRGETPLS